MTEVLLIVLVPLACLAMGAMLSPEIRASLVGSSEGGASGLMNPVYEIFPISKRAAITVHEDGKVTFWDLQTLQAQGEIQSQLPQVQCAGYSEQTQLLALGSRSGSLELWDVNAPDYPLACSELSNQDIHDCCFTPDGKLLITSGYKGLHFWESKTLKLLAQAAPDYDPVLSLAVSPDGRTCLAGTHRGCVQIWDIARRRFIRSIRTSSSTCDNSSGIVDLQYLSDNDQVVAATRENGISVWSLATGNRIRTFSGSKIHVKAGACSSDRSKFIAGDANGRILVWDVLSSRCLHVFHQSRYAIRSVACRDESEFVGGDWMGNLEVHGGRSLRFPELRQSRAAWDGIHPNRSDSE